MSFTLNAQTDQDLDFLADFSWGVEPVDFMYGSIVRRANDSTWKLKPFDGPTMVFSGENLGYTKLTHFGTTLKIPSSGVLTGMTMTSGDDRLEMSFEAPAEEFFRVSQTLEKSLDNADAARRLLSGDDVIRFGSGNDAINAGAGKDRLVGRGGSDTLEGGGGADRILGGSGADILDGGGGQDRIDGNKGSDGLYGGWGDDVLRGQGGHDNIEGGGRHDVLRGGWGRDTLSGGAGRDLLDGGRGDDLLLGGDGRDVFRFNGLKGGRDSIADFTSGKDVIEIKANGVDGFDDLKVVDDLYGYALEFGDTRIVFFGMTSQDVDASDFHFV